MTDAVETAAVAGTAQTPDTQAVSTTAAASTTATAAVPALTADAATTGTTAADAATVAIPAASHEAAKGVFASLAEKLVNFEHALAADAKAEIEKLKTLLHL